MGSISQLSSVSQYQIFYPAALRYFQETRFAESGQMHVTTYMQLNPTTRRAPTRQRLLTAAAQVFARDGLAGSTTREIARTAGVNEVTLFRHFQTKAGLIAAVVGQNFGAQVAQAQTPAISTANLHADLTEQARRYDHLLKENITLIRTMIGEIHHHEDHERQVFKAIFRPLRTTLLERIERAVKENELSDDTSPEVLTDLFSAMIFTGALRRCSSHIKIEYSATSYLNAAVNLIVRGAAKSS
jgi:AcrR family transcriptional regulator